MKKPLQNMSPNMGPISPTFTSPRAYVLRCFLFLVVLGFPLAVLSGQITEFFFQNPFLNALILFTLLLGIFHSFYQILRLNREIYWSEDTARRLVSVGRDDEQIVVKMPPRPNLLAPLAAMLEKSGGSTSSLSPTSSRFLLDSIATRLNDSRSVSRYLIGLLVFLGLLGTFWGLLETISAIGDTVRSLGGGAGDPVGAFEELRAGLEAPLAGMGTAFSSSLFGLAGSLVLGFLDLQAGQAQGRFYNELEEFVSDLTHMEAPRTSAAPVIAGKPSISSADETHVLEDIRRLLMVAEGERAVAGRNIEAIVSMLQKLFEKSGDIPSRPGTAGKPAATAKPGATGKPGTVSRPPTRRK